VPVKGGTPGWMLRSCMRRPFKFAHGLLDHAQHLKHLGDNDAAAAAAGEARGIAQRLRCQPLLDRAADATPVAPQVRA
jgi:hypothetical protein